MTFFVSHSSKDAETAAKICARLEDEGFGSLFVSTEPDHAIKMGSKWERVLYQQLIAKDAVLFLSSPSSLESKWCFAELAIARSLEKRIFPLQIQETKTPHPLIEDVQAISFDADQEQSYRRLLRDLADAGFAPGDRFTWKDSGNPYPGLRSFEPHEAALFFGRDTEIRDLETRLRTRPLDQNLRFVMVTGASGVGKSSLVRAGLLPRLARAQSEWLLILPAVPGPRPVHSIARALSQTAQTLELKWAWKELSEELLKTPEALSTRAWDLLIATGVQAAHGKVLLFIDQLEELFTLATDNERIGFLEVINDGLKDADSPLRGLATMRNEFLDQALEEPLMLPLLQQQFALGSITRAGLRRVVAEPARLAGISFEATLVDRIVDETAGGDALPLLAFTLHLLGEEVRETGHITHVDYEESGGVVEALRRKADVVVEELSDQFGRDRIFSVLRSLVSLNEGREPTRSRVAQKHFDASGRKILKRFRDEHLLTTGEQDGEPIFQISHEALFRRWQPLKLAIEEHRVELETRTRLLRSAEDWERSGCAEPYLIWGQRLAVAEQWLDTHPDEAMHLPRVKEFVASSTQNDLRSREHAADQLAYRILRQLEDDPELATLISLAAIDHYARTPRTLLALNESVNAWRARVAFAQGEWVRTPIYSPHGNRIAAFVNEHVQVFDAASGELLSTLEHAGEPGVMPRNFALAWSPDGALIAAGAANGLISVWDVRSRAIVKILVLPDQNRDPDFSPDSSFNRSEENHRPLSVTDLTFSRDGKLLACGADDGLVMIWRTVDFVCEAEIPLSWGGARTIALSPDGRLIVVGGLDGVARVRDVRDPDTKIQAELRHEKGLWCVDWSADGAWIATGSEDGTARLWRVEEQTCKIEQEHTLAVDAGYVWGIRFSPCSKLVAFVTGRKGLQVWTVGSEVAPICKIDARPVGSNPRFSSDSRCVVIDRERLGVWIWDVQPAGPLLRIGYDIRCAGFCGDYLVLREGQFWDKLRIISPVTGKELKRWSVPGDFLGRLVVCCDGEHMATDHDDGVRLWRVPDGYELGHTNSNGWPAFSPDGSILMVYTRKGLIELWNVKPFELLRRLQVEDEGIWTAALSTEEKQIITCGSESLATWSSESGKRLNIILNYDKVGGDPLVEISPCGRWIAHTNKSGSSGIWELKTGRQRAEFAWDNFNPNSANASVPGSVSISRDGGRIATTSADGSVQVWDAERGELMQLIIVSKDLAASASFSFDGLNLVTTERKGPAKVWPALPPDDLISVARQRSFRSLTEKERIEYGLPVPEE